MMLDNEVIRVSPQVALDLIIMAGFKVSIGAIGGDRYSIQVSKRETITCSDVSLERAIMAAYKLVMSNG